MARYWKATRLNGTDFFTGAIDYAYAQATGQPVVHPRPERGCSARGYFSVATTATDCTGMEWPCRLFVVEPIGETWVPDSLCLPNKVACTQMQVVKEVPAVLALGPQGEHVAALIEQIEALPREEWDRLVGALELETYERAERAERAAHDNNRAAAWCASLSWETVAAALVVRDLIGRGDFAQEDYDVMTADWRTIIGPIHPDDVDLREVAR